MTKKRRTARRALIYLQVCLSFTFTSGSMNSMGFALVCMTNQTTSAEDVADAPESIVQTQCLARRNGSSAGGAHADQGNNPEFDWSSSTQDTLLSASAWGGLLIIMLSWTLDKYGAKWMTLVASLLAMLSNLLTPFTARKNSIAGLLFLRAVQGAGNGMTWPLMAYVCANWAPGHEIGKVIGVITAGNHIGVLINVLVAGEMCRTIGWPYIFYMWGLLLGLWCVMWYFMYADDPEKSSIGMNDEEYAYILKHRSIQESSETGGETGKANIQIPWKSILTSGPVYVLIYASFLVQGYFFFTNDYIPAYLKTVLFLPSSMNGILAALPMLTQAAGKISGGLIADRITGLSETTRAKLFTFGGLALPSGMLIGLSFLDCRYEAAAITLFALSTYFWGFVASGGCFKGMMLLAPRYASTITMFAEIAAFGSGVLLPLVVGAIMPTYTLAHWRHTFYFLATALSSVTIVYTVWGSAELQPWAAPAVPERHREKEAESQDRRFSTEKF